MIGEALELSSVPGPARRRPGETARPARPDSGEADVVVRRVLDHDVGCREEDVQAQVPDLHRRVEANRPRSLRLVHVLKLYTDGMARHDWIQLVTRSHP